MQAYCESRGPTVSQKVWSDVSMSSAEPWALTSPCASPPLMPTPSKAGFAGQLLGRENIFERVHSNGIA